MIIPDNWNEGISFWQKREITAKVAQKKLGMTPAAFYRRIKELPESKIQCYIIARSDTKPNRGESPP